LTWRNFAEFTKVQKDRDVAVVEAMKVRNVLRAQRDPG
jgi:biotin carboxyl carrier protein